MPSYLARCPAAVPTALKLLLQYLRIFLLSQRRDEGGFWYKFVNL